MLFIILSFYIIVSILNKGWKENIIFNRISFILSIYLVSLTLNIFIKLTSELGIGIYGGLFLVSRLTQCVDILIFIGVGLILALTCYYNFINYFLFVAFYLNIFNNLKISLLNFILDKKIKFKSIDYSNQENYYLDNKDNVIYPQLLPNDEEDTKLILSEYPLILFFIVMGGTLLVSSSDLLSIYLSLELQSFAQYILATIHINSLAGTSAGLKYFLLGGFSSGFLLFGSAIIVSSLGTTNLDYIYSIYLSGYNYYIQLGIIILISGLLFKVAAAPFHQWAPDVYDGVPTYSTTWLIVMSKISILAILFDLIHNIGFSYFNLNNLLVFSTSYFKEYNSIFDTFGFINNEIVNNFIINNESLFNNNVIYLNKILIVVSILTMLIGSIVGLSQSRLKRLLAYSTINHLGFMLLTLSINSFTSIVAFLFYIIQYTFTNLNIFFLIISSGFLLNTYFKTDNFKDLNFFFINNTVNENNPSFINNTSAIGDTYSKNYNINDKVYDESLFSPVQYITSIKGQYVSEPFISFSYTITLFSLAGIPPLIGFFAKQLVLLSTIEKGLIFIAFIIIVASLISAAYYLRLVKIIYYYGNTDFYKFIYIWINKHLFITTTIRSYLSEYSKSYYNNQEKKQIFDKQIYNSFLINYLFKLYRKLNNLTTNKYVNDLWIPTKNLSISIAILTNFILFYFSKPNFLIKIVYSVAISKFFI